MPWIRTLNDKNKTKKKNEKMELLLLFILRISTKSRKKLITSVCYFFRFLCEHTTNIITRGVRKTIRIILCKTTTLFSHIFHFPLCTHSTKKNFCSLFDIRCVKNLSNETAQTISRRSNNCWNFSGGPYGSQLLLTGHEKNYLTRYWIWFYGFIICLEK